MTDEQNDEQELPEGATEAMGEPPPLVIGAPFAKSHDCELLDVPLPAGSKGCTAVLKCDDCGQKFKINLLSPEVKHCPNPKCRAAFSHVLLVARTDDTEIVTAAMAQVMRANGFEMASPDDEDDEDEGEGDDDGVVDAEGQ